MGVYWRPPCDSGLLLITIGSIFSFLLLLLLVRMASAQSWVMMISEQHRYQGVSYKSDIIVVSGLDPGDRQVLEQKYNGCDPPCLLDSSDGRFVLKGPGYNPMDVMNCLMTRRGYKVQGQPQQRTLPNIHNKDDKFAMIYHLAKDSVLKRANTNPNNLGLAKPLPVSQSINQTQCKTMEEPDLTRQASDMFIQ